VLLVLRDDGLGAAVVRSVGLLHLSVSSSSGEIASVSILPYFLTFVNEY